MPRPPRGGGRRIGRASKKAKRRGASIVFRDETGFGLRPVNRRTWAPRAQTPVQRAWDRDDRQSVIGTLTLSPTRCRIGTPFQIYQANIRADNVVDFVRQLRKQLQRPLIICWDRWQVHRSATKKIAVSRLKSIEFEWLPTYCPELNPVEARSSNTKHADLANVVPTDTPHLTRNVRSTIRKHQTNQQLKRFFFKTAQLRL